MSDNPLNKAILSRWAIKGLDSSISQLWLGTDGADPQTYLDQISKQMSEGSAPNEELLPRSRFVNLSERTVDYSATCKTIRADFMFYLFGINGESVKASRELVRSVFENGHADVQANADPFVIAGAEVSDLDMIEFEDHPERHGIFYSEILFKVLYAVPRNLSWPASVS